MADFAFATRSKQSPQGKQRVYFTCHPEDHSRYFETARKEILHRQDCAIFYLDPQTSHTEVEDYELRLGEMQLFVIPVTTRLLTTENRTMDIDVPFAKAHHIPILPLMQEEGLTEVFNIKFGDLQFLDPNDRDPTAVPFEEKLTKYLDSILVGDRIAERIRAAFDAYIFLSYRKKDRKYAQQLMRMIHRNPLCRDFAIWYDEYLTPGENFNDSIRHAMEKSDLFTLVVTPGIVEEANYVLAFEYPTARQMGKPVMPVQMSRVNEILFKLLFVDCPEPISAADEDAFSEQLNGMVHEIAVSESGKDNEHKYFIGLAYLSGIDVEVDHERAVKLIREAAEADCIPAIRQMIIMYVNGEGVPADNAKAAVWLHRLAKAAEEKYRTEPDEENAYDLLETLWAESDAYEAYGQYDAAEETLQKMHRYNEEMVRQYPSDRFLSSQASCFRSLAMIAALQREQEAEKKYILEAIRTDESLVRMSGSTENRRSLACDYDLMGNLALNRDNPEEAEAWYRKSFEIVREIAHETGNSRARADLAETYRKLSEVASRCGEMSRAKDLLLKALEIEKMNLEDDDEAGSRRSLAETYRMLGKLAFTMDELQEASDWYTECIRLADRLSGSGMLIDRKFEADCYIHYGDVFMQARMLREAEGVYRKALNAYERMRDEAGTLEILISLADAYFKIGDVNTYSRRMEEAERWYKKSLEILEEARQGTETPEILRFLSRTYSMLGNLGLASREEQKRREAAVWLRKSLEIDEMKAEAAGTNEIYDDLAVSYHNLGLLEQDVSLLEKALAIWEKLERDCPEVPLYHRRVSDTRVAIEKIREMKG